MDTLCSGDVLLADALYCNSFMIASLEGAGIDVLFAQHGASITDFRREKGPAKGDHIVHWQRPYVRPKWMTREQYADVPKQITVWEVDVNGQILVTTMIDHRQESKGELSRLYAMRWNVELDLRNIKTTWEMKVRLCALGRAREVPAGTGLVRFHSHRYPSLGFNPKLDSAGRVATGVWRRQGAPLAYDRKRTSLCDHSSERAVAGDPIRAIRVRRAHRMHPSRRFPARLRANPRVQHRGQTRGLGPDGKRPRKSAQLGS